jgi:cobalt-precorrin-5B (C1)-methyltransferase
MQTLLTGEPCEQVTIDLPGEEGVSFQMVRIEVDEGGVLCGTIKDAGDDPDVTNGAEIQTYVRWQQEPGISIHGGVGVGLVTKPGLPVEVGEHAINPGARRLIERVVFASGEEILDERGLRIEIRVPRGVELAQETMNPRLGIIGGISILGTTGILKPFSNSAFRASIYTELKFAKTNGAERVILTTGSRTETYAKSRYEGKQNVFYVQVGDHMDYALKQCRRLALTTVTISGMIGKLTKLAQGRMQTHVSEGGVDFDFLGTVAQELGADAEILSEIDDARTAHHVQNILSRAGVAGFEERITGLAAAECFRYGIDLDELEVLMFSMRGDLLADAIERRR